MRLAACVAPAAYHAQVDLLAHVLAVTDALTAAGVDYALCGGVALAVHGFARATIDIDLLARPDQLDALRAAVAACGFTIEALPMDFASGVTMRRLTNLAVGGKGLMLDVLLVTPTLDAVWASRERVSFTTASGSARSLWVVSRAGLVTLKLAAGRPQDLVDIARLQEADRGHEP